MIILSKLIYYCKNNDDNNCPKKDTCKRFLECTDDKNSTTLYKLSCTENNEYKLYIKRELEENTNE